MSALIGGLFTVFSMANGMLDAVVQAYITQHNLDQQAIETVIASVNEMLAAPQQQAPAEPLSLNVGIGNLVVRPGVEPADVGAHTQRTLLCDAPGLLLCNGCNTPRRRFLHSARIA